MNDELKQITIAVQQWAETIPYEIRIYLFGSFINSTPKPDSDIDIALEFTNSKEVPKPMFMWFKLHTYWVRQLSRLLTRKPHLCLYDMIANQKANTDTQSKDFLTSKKYRLIYESASIQTESAS